MSIGIVLLVLHAAVCAAAGIFILTGFIKSGKKLLVIVLAVPFWGAFCLLLQERSLRKNSVRRKETGIEKLKINDEIYRSILKDEDHSSGNLVPFEDALIINDAKTRRELVMDIMYSDPSQYIDLLKHARMDEDTEVVHYATTAMVELQKEYDSALKALAERVLSEPESAEQLKVYALLLEEYIGSGLLEGNMLVGQRRKFSEIMSRYLELCPEERQFWRRKAENDLALRDLEGAGACMDELMTRWPMEEDGYLLKIQYELIKNNREGIDSALNELKQREISLTPAGKDTVRFWTEGEQNEEAGEKE